MCIYILIYIDTSVITHIHMYIFIYMSTACFFVEWLAKRLLASWKGQLNELLLFLIE